MQGFLAWINQPFDGSMSAYRWFAFVGLLIAILVIWTRVLRTFDKLGGALE